MTSAITAGGWLGLVYLIAVLVWLVSELVFVLILPIVRASKSVTVSRARPGSGGVILLGIFVAIILTTAFARAGLATFPSVVVYVGVLLIFVGVGIRQWAIATLGQYFSPVLRRVAGHHVVTRGPYRWVRHPSYTGALVTLLGFGLAGGSWEGLLAVLVISALVFSYRIRIEERFLLAEFGDEYQAYRDRTKRLLPLIW